MRFNKKKYLEKLKRQNQTNPGNKTTYDRPWRGRHVVFEDKTKYNRKRIKDRYRKSGEY